MLVAAVLLLWVVGGKEGDGRWFLVRAALAFLDVAGMEWFFRCLYVF